MTDAPFPKRLSTIELIKFLAPLQFRPFTKQDWYAYAGCESEFPHIAEFGDPLGDGDGGVVIVDGDQICVYDGPEGEGNVYQITDPNG